MARLLAILTLILSIVLFPPAVLALISNNAVPGDTTYPIKRALEDVIYSVASVNPVTKAWFSAARSDRRFQEFNILVTQGKQSDKTLNELVEQTQTTANQIAQISDRNQKAQLVEKLSESIKKYDKGLEEIGKVSTPTSKPVAQPTSAPAIPSPAPIVPAAPTIHPTSKPTSKPTFTPMPTATPHPTQTSQPSPTPEPEPSPAPPPPPSQPSSCEEIKDSIERARCRLEKIKVGLGAQSDDVSPRQENRGDRKEFDDRGKREDVKQRDKSDEKSD